MRFVCAQGNNWVPVGIALTVAIMPALAQADQRSYAVIPGLRASPTLEVRGMYTDNFFHAHRGRDEESGYGVIVKPDVVFTTVQDNIRTSAGGGVEQGWFDFPGPLDDYLDYHANGLVQIQPSTRDRYSLEANFRHGHDPIGTARTAARTTAGIDHLDEWNQSVFSGRYRFGAVGARINLELNLSHVEKDYTTNRRVSLLPLLGTRYLDFKTNVFDAEALYHLTPKTAAVTDFAIARTTFDHAFPNGFRGDSKEVHLRGGVRWQATAKTSGDIRVGGVVRQFDEDQLPTYHHTDWLASILWSPRERTSFKLETGRDSTETYRNDTRVINEQFASLNWSYQWTYRVRSNLGVGYTESEFVGAHLHDGSLQVQPGVDFVLRSNIVLFANAQFYDRMSNETIREFHRNDVYVGFRFNP